MDTLFEFEEDQPQEQKPPTDWQGKEIPVSDNPMIRRFGRGPEGKKCKECKFMLWDYYHNTTYRKCEKRGITRGKGTDHKVSFDVCSKFEQEEPEPPNQPFTEICPQCKGPIKVLYSWGVWACPKCNIKIAQTREEGITRIEPLAVFRVN